MEFNNQQAFSRNLNIPAERVAESPVRGFRLISLPDSMDPLFINADATFFGYDRWIMAGKGQPVNLSGQESVLVDMLIRIRWEMLVDSVCHTRPARIICLVWGLKTGFSEPTF